MSADEKGFKFHAQPQTGAYSCSVLDSLFCNLSVLKPRGHYFFHLKAFANIFLIIINSIPYKINRLYCCDISYI